MRGKLLAAPVMAVGLALGLIGGATAAAPAKAKTTVTIKAEGTDLSGLVKSPRPRLCAKDRLVIVFKQRGARGGGDDERFAMDTASKQGNLYKWSTGQTGTEGRFYARVRATDDCKADTSPTIRATRNP